MIFPMLALEWNAFAWARALIDAFQVLGSKSSNRSLKLPNTSRKGSAGFEVKTLKPQLSCS